LMNDVFHEYLDDFVVFLQKWHHHFFKEHGGPWVPCMFSFKEASRSWTVCQIREVWIPSNWSGILGLHHL
jgi:hypothetical protein